MGFDKPYLGVLAGMGAAFGFSFMDTVIKVAMTHYPMPLVIFLQACVVLPILLLYSHVQHKPFLRGSHYPRLQMLRALVHAGSGLAGFAAFAHMPLATFYTIGFLGPLLVALLAWVVFREPPSTRTRIALGLGFLGMLVICRPDTLPFNTATFYAFIWIVCCAVNILFVRKMPLDHPNIFTAYTYTALFVVIVPLAVPHLHLFQLQHFYFPLLGGLGAVVANYLFYTAYQLAPVARVAPMQYTQLVWGALAGWLLFNTAPTIYLWGGAALIAVAGWLVLSQPGAPIPSHTQRRVPKVE
ncbi:MAG: DMT family transporter [Bdellovibrionales bacterium]